MMIRRFLDLVEIKTKVASMIPFLMGTVYAIFHFHTFNGYHWLLMLVSLLSFDMATTAINNYYDYKKAVRTHGYGYEMHNAVVRYGMKERSVVLLIAVLLFLAIGAGIMLVFETGLLIFLLGGLSFCVGILYSFGPIPISRMPLGELFSGLFMGFVIIFISTYIHVPGDQLVSLTIDSNLFVHLDIQLVEVLLVFGVSIPAILAIANIMLANNICDVEDDMENRRYTLPVYIGKPNALVLYRYIYYAAYLDIFVLFYLRVHPVLLLLLLCTLIPVHRNIKRFESLQTKKDTFILAVRNFVLINVTRIIVLALAAIWS
jgi:1,4-dihydroxy-2-naphthoate octaprenyltransferase